MSKQSRLLGLTLFIVFAILLGTTIWKQRQLERARVVRIEIIRKPRLIVTTPPPIQQKWIWSGTQAQFIFDQLNFDSAGCIGPVNKMSSLDYLSIKALRNAEAPLIYNFDLQDGVTSPDKENCERFLTPQSLKYFRDYVAQTPPNAK